jgi:EthD domain
MCGRWTVDVEEDRNMLRLLVFLSKRAGMPAAEFIDYYENRHVPLILSLTPAPAVYRRHYLRCGGDTDAGSMDFDVVTELQWLSLNDFRQWMTAVTTGAAGARVAADEERFLDRSRTRSSIVTSYVTNSTNDCDYRGSHIVG